MFSELVDKAVSRSSRLDRRLDIIDYANATLRECQGLALFWKDLVEDQAACAAADPTTWDIPQRFRFLKAVMYPDGTFPPNEQPGKNQGTGFAGTLKDQYYYAASTYVVFHGCGTTTTDDISLAYYKWFPRLKYYAEDHRPAVYSEELETWTYYDLTADGLLDYTQVGNQEAARNLVTNWMLTDYHDLIITGTLAKLFSGIKDAERNIQNYSLYKSQQELLKQTEPFEKVP
jgi:hypothetical protein